MEREILMVSDELQRATVPNHGEARSTAEGRGERGERKREGSFVEISGQ